MKERPGSLVPLGRGFVVGPSGMTFEGEPTFESWAKAVRGLVAVRSAAQWAVGDLLLYADTRGWDDAQVETVLSTLGLKRGTLYNLKSVAKAFPLPTRKAELPWSHHAIVCSLGNETAAALLTRSVDERWGYDELKTHARSARALAARQDAWPEGTFTVQVSDCPWFEIGSADHRPLLTKDDLCALAPKVQAITAPDAVHYMLTPSAKVPDALDVLRAWGFGYRGSAVIVSDTTHSQGWFRDRHAWMLIGTRGHVEAPSASTIYDSVLDADKSVTGWLDACHGEVPKALLFPREPRDGWTSVGLVDAAPPTRGIVLEDAVVVA